MYCLKKKFTDDGGTYDGQRPIPIAHLEPLAQKGSDDLKRASGNSLQKPRDKKDYMPLINNNADFPGKLDLNFGLSLHLHPYLV